MRPGPYSDSPSSDRPRGPREPASARRWKRRRATLESLEQRALLATIPAPSLIDRIDISNNTANPAVGNRYATNDNSDESAPTIVVDPADPNRLAASWVRFDPDLPANEQILVEAAFSSDGGASWRKVAANQLPNRRPDPSTTNPVRPYPNIDGAGVAFAPDGSGQFYLLELQHNGLTSGELILARYSPTGQMLAETTIYAWNRSATNQSMAKAIVQPTLAVDGTLPSFTDPDTGQVVVNPHVGNIYIAYIGDTPPPQNPPTNPPWNRETVELYTSTDGGATFGLPLVLNNGGNSPLGGSTANANRGIQENARPRIAVSQGGGGAQPGQVTVIWDDSGTRAAASNNPARGQIYARQVFDGGTTLGVQSLVAESLTVLGNLQGGGSVGGPTALGIGPQPSIAADNTLGSAPNALAPNGTPFSTRGRLYVAYAGRSNVNGNPADNTDIFLTYSDDGGVTWQSSRKVNDDNATADGFSEASNNSGRPQFLPEVAVDNATGTVVVQFYDTRYDASRLRAATIVTASIDGGQTFSPQKDAYVNAPEAVLDLATGQYRSTGPIPDNQATGNPNSDGTFGYGIRQGLAVVGGRVYTAWAGNENGGPDGRAFLDIRVARSTIAAGPRIVSGTSGVVTTTDTGTPLGTPQAQQFLVTFDRPVDVSTFDTSDVEIRGLRFDGTPLPAITANDVQPLDAFLVDPGQPATSRRGASQFLVTFPAQQTPGTYSYAVGPGIQSLAGPGPQMDQDGDATAGEPQQDRFAVPGMIGGVPFTTPTPGTLPLIVPGPRVVSKQVITDDGTYGDPSAGENLVLNGTVAAFRVTFDRDMKADTFGPEDVLRIVGPGGLVDRGSFTVTPIGAVDGVTRTFEIGFARQQLNGTYQLQLGPNIQSVLGYLVDSNQNAGVDALRNTTRTAYTSAGPTTVRNNTVDATITVPDDFTLRDIDVRINATTVGTADLTISLVAPDGTVIPLYSAARSLAAPGIFSNTTFDDQAPLSVLEGRSPYLAEYRPIGRLADLETKLSAGIYRLRFASASAAPDTALGVVNSWSLDLARHQDPLASPTVEVRYDSADVPKAIPVRGVATSQIVIPENFRITDLNLQLDIAHTNVPDLRAELVGPDGTTVVRLFTNVGNSGTTDDFQNTIFDDQADLPISSGGPPFASRFRPEQPLSALNTAMAAGTYTLRVFNEPGAGQAGVDGMLNSWRLILQRALPGDGLGEPAADRIDGDFRIFTMDPVDGLSSSTWTAVGPASINDGGGAGRVTGLAVDPSDPSGNTVYAGGASGGVWKTNNFLTTDPEGPTWTPLLDQVATFGMNIGGIAVFGRNGDPNQSIVFVATGEGDSGTRGVGLLRSMDGGRTWTLLDSLDNRPALAGRGHELVGLTAFKVIVDPKPTAAGDTVIFAAFSGTGANGNGGIYRSIDTGATWERVLAGDATDVELDPTSGTIDPFTNPTGNLQIAFAAIRGQGVSISSAQGRAGSWSLMAGNTGKPQLLDIDVNPVVPVPTNAPTDTPNGNKGRIVLARPLSDGTQRGDLIYGGWLYAAVATGTGGLDGLYLTKDYGANWTRLSLPNLAGNANRTVPTNDNSTANTDYQIFGSLGNFNIALTVDPTDPNVVYLGGGGLATSLIRIDARDVHDPHAYYLSSQLPGGAERRNDANGPVSMETVANGNPSDDLPPAYNPNTLEGYDPRTQATVNLLRNPFNITDADSTLRVDNADRFSNTGAGVRWIPFDEVLDSTGSVHRAISYVDPVSGRARLIFGDNQGIFTGVDAGDGTLLTSVGNNDLPTGSRNGNIQIAQLYNGAAQPTDLAAQIAGALFYGQAQDVGFPRSDPDLLETGNLSWTGPFGTGTDVATDQTGSGTAYEYNLPCCGGTITGFFRVDLPDGSPFNSAGRTNGLIQGSGGSPSPDPQWPFGNPGANFAVNPINRNEMVIAAPGGGGIAPGRIFRTLDQGLNWFEIRPPSGSFTAALAFGSPVDATTTITGDHILFGNEAGALFVTYNGGATWTQINNGALAGNTSPVRVIAPNPAPGSREAYAVTGNAVYHIDDTLTGTWTNITGNLFQLTQQVFGDPNAVDTLLKPGNLKALAPDWRYVIPDNFDTPPNPPTTPTQTHPVLYVAGEGGVFVSYDDGASWRRFPSAFADSISTTPQPPGDGGGLPVADVRDLDLALGNVERTTGQPRAEADGATSPDLLVATTFGRGAYAIRLAPVVFPDSLRLNLDGQRIPNGGAPPVLRPTDLLFTGYSARSDFGNTITIQAFELDDNDQIIRTLTLDAPVTTGTDGSFTLQINQDQFPEEGVKRIGLQAVNQSGTAGNIAVFELILDDTPPAAPGRPDLLDASDTGSSSFDNVTGDRTPVFQVGGVEAGATVRLYRDGDLAASGVVPAGGSSIQLTDPGPDLNNDGIPDGVPDGTYLYTADQVDAVGNEGPVSEALQVVVTSGDPAADPLVPDLVAASDSGRSQSDNITNVTTPTFQLNGQAGEVIELLRKPGGAPSGQYEVVGTRTGPGTLTDNTSGPLADGIYDYATRRGGGTPTLPLAVRIDTQAPPPPGTAPDLDAASDTGFSNTDDLTNSVNPAFTVGGLERDAIVQLLRDGALAGTSPPVGATGAVTVTDTAGAPAGVRQTYAYTAVQVDVAGNASVAGPGLPVTIDPLPPAAPIAPDLQPGSDTGISNIDGLTAASAPAFTVGGVEAGAVVRLLRNGAVVSVSAPAGPGGSVTVNDPTTPGDGRYVYTALQIDPAGNVGAESPGLTVTFDRQIQPPTAPDLQPGSDTGISTTDDITSAGALTFDVGAIELNPDAMAAPVTLRLLRDGVQVGAATHIGGGTTSITDPGPVPAGPHTYTVVQVDAAGNISAAGPGLTVTVDLAAPAAPGRPDLQDASDTGLSNTDNLTADRTPSFDVSGAEPGARVRLFRQLVGSGTAAVQVAEVVAGSSGGTVTLTDPGPVADGAYDYTAVQVDVAGNVGLPGPALAVTIKGGPPPAPTAPDLRAASDTGLSNTDNITSATAPIFDIGGLLVSSTVTVQLFRRPAGGGAAVEVNQITTVAAGGTQMLADPGPVPDGVYDYTAVQTDASGNVSAASAATRVTIDTVAPAAADRPDLQAASDTGSSDFDNITAARTLVFDIAGVAPGAQIRLIRNGSPVGSPAVDSDGDGKVTISDPGPVADGVYTYLARPTDVAGNVGPDGPAIRVVVTADDSPAGPPPPDLVDASDTGSSATDDVTADTTPTLQISAPAGQRVQLLRKPAGAPSSQFVKVGEVTGNGLLTEAGALADGAFAYVVQQLDAAGNVGPASGELVVVVDSTAPAAPTGLALLPADDSGVPGDGTTNVKQPRLVGTLPLGPGETAAADLPVVQVIAPGDVLIGQAQVNADGSFTIQPAAPLADSVYVLVARAVDRAGNVGPGSTSLALRIDTVPPGGVTLGLSPSDDTGGAGDNITSIRRPRLIGNTGAGLRVELIDVDGAIPASAPGAVVGAATTSQPNGAFMLNFPFNLPDGTYTLVARVTNAAGNTVDSAPLVLTILNAEPAGVPTLRLAPESDTGLDGDGRTSDRRPFLVGETNQPNATIEVIGPDGAVLASGTTDDQGGYRLRLASNLANGSIALRSRTRGPSGVPGPFSNPLTLAIEATAGDFDNDGRADLALYRPGAAAGESVFLISRSTAGPQAVATADFRPAAPNSSAAGAQPRPGDIPIAGDFDGDGILDVGVFRPSSDQLAQASEWIILGSRTGPRSVLFGGAGLDVPAVGDFDGDGRDDIAVFRPISDLTPGASEWLILPSSTGQAFRVAFGAANGVDLPAVADYDGDGRDDIATFRPSPHPQDLVAFDPEGNGIGAQWFILRSGLPAATAGLRVEFGAASGQVAGGQSDQPVPADYDGDGRADIAAYRPSTSEWFILRSGLPMASAGLRVEFGAAGDRPAPADYDGDGIADLVTFRPSAGRWTVRQSTDGRDVTTDFGAAGDVPLLAPLAYRDPRPNSIANPTPAPAAPQAGQVAQAAQAAGTTTVPDMGRLASQLGGGVAGRPARAQGGTEALARLRALRGDAEPRPAGGLRGLLDSVLARRGGRPKA